MANSDDIVDNTIINTIIHDIIEKRINDLLLTISRHFPDKFKKQHIKTELPIIMEKINITMIQPKPIPNPPIPNQLIPDPKPRPVKISIENRCHARIWSNKIYKRIDNLPLNKPDLPDKYRNITDFNDIDIKEFNKLYIIGGQCKRAKLKDAEYCRQHITRQIHGDYNKKPTKEMAYHFLHDAHYLE